MKLISAITVAIMAAGSFLGSKGNFKFADNVSSTEKTEIETIKSEESDFEKAVKIIKKYEGLHQPRHYPLVGYGHLVLPGEKFNRKRAMGEAEAEKLLRKDLLKNCAVFRAWGPDSLILGVLAYNIGSGATLRSSVAKKLKAGNRDIYEIYIAHSRYRGKVHAQIKRRRIEEFETLFIKESPKPNNEPAIKEEPAMKSAPEQTPTRVTSQTARVIGWLFMAPLETAWKGIAQVIIPAEGYDKSYFTNTNSLMACIK